MKHKFIKVSISFILLVVLCNSCFEETIDLISDEEVTTGLSLSFYNSYNSYHCSTIDYDQADIFFNYLQILDIDSNQIVSEINFNDDYFQKNIIFPLTPGDHRLGFWCKNNSDELIFIYKLNVNIAENEILEQSVNFTHWKSYWSLTCCHNGNYTEPFQDPISGEFIDYYYPYVGEGPNFENISSLCLSINNNKIIALDKSNMRLFEIDIDNGERNIVSSSTNYGLNSLTYPIILSSNSKYVFAFYSEKYFSDNQQEFKITINEVEPSNGNRDIIAEHSFGYTDSVLAGFLDVDLIELNNIYYIGTYTAKRTIENVDLREIRLISINPSNGSQNLIFQKEFIDDREICINSYYLQLELLKYDNDNVLFIGPCSYSLVNVNTGVETILDINKNLPDYYNITGLTYSTDIIYFFSENNMMAYHISDGTTEDILTDIEFYLFGNRLALNFCSPVLIKNKIYFISYNSYHYANRSILSMDLSTYDIEIVTYSDCD